MAEQPTIEERADQPYVAILATVTMKTIGSTLPPLIGEVAGWLEAHQVAPAGAPFWKYNVIDMERELEVEVGFPVATAVPGDEPASGGGGPAPSGAPFRSPRPEIAAGRKRVRAGVLPAGRYAVVTHVGSAAGLRGATARLLAWAEEQGLTWDKEPAGATGERWGARLEVYETDPDQEPDRRKWETVLAFRLA